MEDTKDEPPAKIQKTEQCTDKSSQSQDCKDITAKSFHSDHYKKSEQKNEEITTLPVKIQTELDVGITEYISEHEGFHGVIKQRYSDFLVWEIDDKNTRVKLTDTSIPEIKEDVIPNDVLSVDVRDKLQSLLDSNDKTGHIDIQVPEDKLARTLIHKTIRNLFPSLFSNTQEEDGKKVIRVGFDQGSKRNHSQKYLDWPRDQGDYCHFVLYKEGKDTADAISVIAKFLKLKSSLFSYAGMKDRRAKTSQLISAYRVHPKKLQPLNKILRGITLGNFSYTKKELKLGDLRGNHFCIVLRNVTGSAEEIDVAMKSMQVTGFINYYGMQRFGTTDVPTHHVGQALLHSNWSEAIDLILKPRSTDNNDLAECRKIWQTTRDAKAALKVLKRYCMERQLLEGLSKCHENDLLSAIKTIPRNSRLMYIHSYQSYVWNKLVSRRIQEFGLKPVVGDLVLKDTGGNASEKKNVIELAEDTVENYAIHDVVMPLPGYDVVYPANKVKEWYKDMLSEAELDIDSMKHKVKDFSLPGDYRKILEKPCNVSWRLYSYNDITVPLVRSDADLLNGEPEPADVADGKYTALVIEFSLNSSCYATMALREILKTDTSAAHQSTLNVT